MLCYQPLFSLYSPFIFHKITFVHGNFQLYSGSFVHAFLGVNMGALYPWGPEEWGRRSKNEEMLKQRQKVREETAYQPAKPLPLPSLLAQISQPEALLPTLRKRPYLCPLWHSLLQIPSHGWGLSNCAPCSVLLPSSILSIVCCIAPDCL